MLDTPDFFQFRRLDLGTRDTSFHLADELFRIEYGSNVSRLFHDKCPYSHARIFFYMVTHLVTMSEPVPAYAQEAYAILRTRFASDSFTSDYLAWFISSGMVKKTLHTLERAGWVKRIEKGRYVCVNADDIFRSMVVFRVPQLLRESGMKFTYTGSSAVEVWTDYSYMQRSWEHSPYFVKVLRTDLRRWIDYFRKHKIKVFISNPETSLGEFIVLEPKERLTGRLHNGLPVDQLNDVVRYCEKYIETFEYPLAYMKAKFGIKSSAVIDERVLAEASKVAA